MKLRELLSNGARGLLLGIAASAPLWLGRLANWQIPAFALCVCAVVLLLVASGRRVLPDRRQAADVLLVLFIGASILSAFYSVYVYASVMHVVLGVAGVTAFVVTRAALREGAWRRAGWWAISGGGLIAALWGLREYTTNVFLLDAGTWRAFGPFYNPNCLGGYLALVLLVPIALALGAQTRGPNAQSNSERRGGPREARGDSRPPTRYREIFGVIIAVVLGLGLVVTGSKGAMIAAVAGLIAFAFMAAERGSRLGAVVRWTVGGILVAVIVLIAALPPMRARVVSALSTQKHSASFRLHTWRGTLDMIAARPLVGFGPGTFAVAYPKFARAGYTRQAHQTPLQLAAENGIIAAGLMFAGIVAAFAAIVRALPEMSGRRRLLAAAAVGGAVGLWVHNLVDYTWFVVANNGAFWLLLGLAYPRAQKQPEQGETRPWRTWAIGVGMLVMMLVSIGILRSEIELNRGQRLAALGALDMAEKHFKRITPLNARRWVELSRVYEQRGRYGQEGAFAQARDLRIKAVQLQPTEPTHYNALGRIYVYMSDGSDRALQTAEQWLKRGLEVCPTSTEILASLGQVQQALGKDDAALQTFRRLTDLYDSPVRTARAVEYFVDENYAFGFMALAEHAREQGDTERMVLLATNALDVASRWVQSQRRYRELLEVGGRYNPEEVQQIEAVAAAAMQMLSDTEDPVGQLYVGLGAWRLERMEKAVATLERLIDRLEAPRGAVEEAIAAQANLTLARCYREVDMEGQARNAEREGVRLGRSALEGLQGDRGAEQAGWRERDTARLRAAIDAARTADSQGAGARF